MGGQISIVRQASAPVAPLPHSWLPQLVAPRGDQCSASCFGGLRADRACCGRSADTSDFLSSLSSPIAALLLAMLLVASIPRRRGRKGFNWSAMSRTLPTNAFWRRLPGLLNDDGADFYKQAVGPSHSVRCSRPSVSARLRQGTKVAIWISTLPFSQLLIPDFPLTKGRSPARIPFRPNNIPPAHLPTPPPGIHNEAGNVLAEHGET